MIPAIRIIILVAAAWLIGSVIKIISKRSTKAVFAYGGMPSDHMTFVTAMCTSLLLVTGFDTVFLLSCALWILVLNDLIVLRRKIDENSRIKISHTPVEIAIGIALGIVVPIILNAII